MPNPAVAGSCTVGSFDCKNPAVLNATQPLQDLQPPVINLPSLLLQLPCGAKVPAQQVGVWVVMNGLTDASSTTAWARCWTGTHVYAGKQCDALLFVDYMARQGEDSSASNARLCHTCFNRTAHGERLLVIPLTTTCVTLCNRQQLWTTGMVSFC